MSRRLSNSCGRLKAAKGSKTTTKQDTTSTGTGTSTNTFGTFSPMDDPRYADAVDDLGGFQFQHDPRIGNTFSRQRQSAHDSFQNPMGGFTSPALRQSILRASDEDSAQNESQAYMNENFGFQGMKYGQLHDQATMKRPNVVQTGGTTSTSGSSSGSGTSQVQQPFDFNSILQGGASIGSAALM